MFTDPHTVRVLIVCATIFALGVIGAVAALAITGHDTAAILAVIGAPLGTWLVNLSSRVRAVHEAVQARKDETQ